MHKHYICASNLLYNFKIMKKTVLVFVALFLLTLNLSAQINKSPAIKKPVEYKQPDGSTVTITLKGDEKMHWAETADGYTLVAFNSTAYEYACLDKNGNLISSGIAAHNPDKRTKKEKKLLKKTPKNLAFSEKQIEDALDKKK